MFDIFCLICYNINNAAYAQTRHAHRSTDLRVLGLALVHRSEKGRAAAESAYMVFETSRILRMSRSSEYISMRGARDD